MELALTLLTHIIVEVAKALALVGSFKLVTLSPRTVSEMTELPKETQKNGDTNQQEAQLMLTTGSTRLLAVSWARAISDGTLT